ncbi:MAG: hypothetical protein P8013_12310 [Candidatus Sulfobium sp.]
MKAYFIFNDSSLKEDKLLPLLSALVNVDTVGSAPDLLEAVDVIRQQHSDAFIFDSSVLDVRGTEFLTPHMDDRGPLVILPRNYQIKEACTYISVSFEFKQLYDYKWLMSSIGCMIRQYHGQDAR